MQLVAERQSVDTIRAQMNYIVDTGVPPVRYIDWPEMAHKEIPPQYKQHEMTIRNGRPLRDTFKLDTHGFVFADHHTMMKDFTDETERKRVYDREVAELIKKHSGASEVLVFDHTIRIGDEQAMKAINARPPVKGVHNDYTENSAPRRLREIAGDAEAERRFKNGPTTPPICRSGTSAQADPTDQRQENVGQSEARSATRPGLFLLWAERT